MRGRDPAAVDANSIKLVAARFLTVLLYVAFHDIGL
jgi:hypothetical protein